MDSIQLMSELSITIGPVASAVSESRMREVLAGNATITALYNRVNANSNVSLKAQHSSYIVMAKSNASFEDLAKAYMKCVSTIENAEGSKISVLPTADARIRATLGGLPAAPRMRDGKADRRISDRNRRNAMKGSTSGGGKKQKAGR